MRKHHWPEGETMNVSCPSCEARVDVQISVVREDDLSFRPVDCGSCGAEFDLTADGATVVTSAHPKESTAWGRELLERTIIFDPAGAGEAPFITEVEVLLGGVARLVFPDGTEQFVDDDEEPVHVYSPRLLPEALERFCEANIERYQEFNDKYARQLMRCERVPMEQFW